MKELPEEFAKTSTAYLGYVFDPGELTRRETHALNVEALAEQLLSWK
jgi:hypothetical protein